MQTRISRKDKDRIKAGIHGKYRKVASSPEGLFKYTTGKAGLETLNYDSGLVGALPDAVSNAYCGVGNPFSLGPVNPGDAVLDIGCGAGVDTLLAAMMAGPGGTAAGVDLTAEMVERAESNLKLTGLKNVTFQIASGEKLPFEDSRFDVVISNGVINLIPDKAATLEEVWRVLKPGGSLMIADQILKGPPQTDERERIDKWAQWEGGAIPGKDFLALLQQAGFTDVELVAETGFNSSPKTLGTLFKAAKPVARVKEQDGTHIDAALADYQAFMDGVYGENAALDRKTRHLIALGASLAAGCDNWAQYCLAVARQLGTTEEELKEVMALAMTVGATKIRILQEGALAAMQEEDEPEAAAPEEACSTWAT